MPTERLGPPPPGCRDALANRKPPRLTKILPQQNFLCRFLADSVDRPFSRSAPWYLHTHKHTFPQRRLVIVPKQRAQLDLCAVSFLPPHCRLEYSLEGFFGHIPKVQLLYHHLWGYTPPSGGWVGPAGGAGRGGGGGGHVRGGRRPVVCRERPLRPRPCPGGRSLVEGVWLFELGSSAGLSFFPFKENLLRNRKLFVGFIIYVFECFEYQYLDIFPLPTSFILSLSPSPSPTWPPRRGPGPRVPAAPCCGWRVRGPGQSSGATSSPPAGPSSRAPVAGGRPRAMIWGKGRWLRCGCVDSCHHALVWKGSFSLRSENPLWLKLNKLKSIKWVKKIISE